jgi:dihydrodipicolinate synthase/N-acetylneuraminate lyase
MGEILGLTDEEQLEVYRAVVDVIRSRLDRAKSSGKKKKLIEGVDIDSLTSTIVKHVKEEDK